MLCALGKQSLWLRSKGGVMRLLPVALLVSFALVSQAFAQEFSLTIKDHRIQPAELEVPAGKAFTLNVTNQDATAEEFESNDLDIEKIIAGGQSAVINVDALDPGRYEFYGEYHEDSAKGAIVAK
jgi:plastocyanin